MTEGSHIAYPVTIDVMPRGEDVLIQVVNFDTGAVVFKMVFPPDTIYRLAQNCTVAAMKAEGAWNE